MQYHRDLFTRVHREPCEKCRDEGEWIIACAFCDGFIEGFIIGYEEGRESVQSKRATKVVLTLGKPKEN